MVVVFMKYQKQPFFMPENNIEPILVGLERSATDDYIFSFLRENGKALTSGKTHFIHIDHNLSKGDFSREPGKKIIDELNKKVPREIDNFVVHLEPGEPEKTITYWGAEKNINLIVLGHKNVPQHQVEVSEVVEKPACSLLLVPEIENYKVKKIAVAIDFSDLSLKALKEGERLATAMEASLVAFHCYQVPSGYHKSGKDHKEFAEVMEDHARKDAASFLKEGGISHLKVDYVYDDQNNPAECIENYARNNAIDFLLMGSHGRTSAASLLMGSVAKKLIKSIYHIPVMIIKAKNENMGLMDAVKKI